MGASYQMHSYIEANVVVVKSAEKKKRQLLCSLYMTQYNIVQNIPPISASPYTIQLKMNQVSFITIYK